MSLSASTLSVPCATRSSLDLNLKQIVKFCWQFAFSKISSNVFLPLHGFLEVLEVKLTLPPQNFFLHAQTY